jgi:hypothetical protein
MSELRLDYQQKLSFTWAGLALLVLAIITLILSGAYYLKVSSQTSSWESRFERVRGKAGAFGLSGKSNETVSPDLAQEVNNANVVLRQLSIPWDALFEAVESSAERKVTLLALEPDVEKQQVKITGETKDYKSLMNYLMKMQEYPIFGSIYLQNHHIQLQEPDQPVRFTLLATWQENP